jgi:hypothetical protein
MVLAIYCSAMAKRTAELLRRVGVERDFVITGGIKEFWHREETRRHNQHQSFIYEERF